MTNAILDETKGLHLIEYITECTIQPELHEWMQEVLEKMSEEYEVDSIRIRGIQDEKYSLRFLFEYMKYEGARRIGEITTFSKDNWERFMQAYSLGYYVYYADEEHSENFVLGQLGVDSPKSLLQIPIYYRNRFIGTMEFVNGKNGEKWSEEEIQILRTIGRILARFVYSQCNVNGREDGFVCSIDGVTGFNRYEKFLCEMEEQLPKKIDTRMIMITYSDIYHFKYINETYGYKKGDELLRVFARELQSSKELIGACRVHSDNFVAVYALPMSGKDTLFEDVEILNHQITEQLQKYCPEVNVSINTGVFYMEDETLDIATAVAHANLARKNAKKRKGRRCVEFNNEMMNEIRHQEYLNRELPKAIENHNLMVYYQPKICCNDEGLSGAEALIRWKKDDGTFIYPDEFIPVFEQNGNIVDVDYYVYEEVFSYIRRRLDQNLPVVQISMNVSRIHLEDHKIIHFIRHLFEKYKIPSRYIEFELTENIYINNLQSAQEFIDFCKEMDIHVSMDDFGSGYSSLNVMSSLPIDILKVDKIFLKNEELTMNDKIVLESVIGMAKKLNMKVLCEGVETKSQSDFLRKIHCDMIQGYYYGRPMNESNFNEFVNNHQLVRC